MIADALAWLAQGAVASTAALLCVFVLRAPARALFGARVAYGLWMLVPAALLAVSLPGPAMEFAARGVQGVAAGAVPSVRVGLATALQPMTSMMSSPSAIAPGMLALVWACGALAMALWSWRLQHRFVSALGPLAARGDGLFAAESTSTSPAVIGAWRSRIVLPADFDARYPAEEGALVIAHEREHVRRSDVRINLFVVVLRCLHWFNPLLHWAAAKFRFDQELACDAAVLAAHPDSRRAYAGAMLKTQLAVLGLPVGCHWQSSQSLKERILMLKKPIPGTWHRRAGVLAVAAVLASGSYAAWALQGPVSDTRLQFVGHMSLEGRVAYAVFEHDLFKGSEISGVEMASSPGAASTAVVLDASTPLIVSTRNEDGRSAWTLSMWGEGSTASPGVRWELDGDGSTRRTGRQRIIGANTLLDVVLPATADGRTKTVALTPLPVKPPTILPVHDLVRDGDGAWRDQRGMVQGDLFGGIGDAVLVAELGADGRVRDVRIESMSQPGLLTAEAARDLMSRNVYRMPGDGALVAGTQVRKAFAVGPVMPPARTQVFVGASAATAGKAAVHDQVSTPAPAYPAKALADRIGGHVLLHLRVATDGSVKDARVAMSTPEGIFDQAALEAVRKWKLQPEVRDGKPVESWMQVPITFEPDRKPASPGAGA